MEQGLEAILPYAVVPGAPGVFVCGCLERWVSIHLQAVRGFNLAWALEATGALGAGARACVVGGGFAGLAVAAGLGRRGVRVSLLEAASSLLHTQRSNHVRHIHPHIHEWPRPGARQPRAGLPLLDWTAGLSAAMAAEVLAGFDAEVRRFAIEVRCDARPVTLVDGPAVSAAGAAAERFDAVVLALGVGIERSFGALPLSSYWADEDIATIRQGGAPRHHLVTGVGEGGVIDVLYLRLARFAHAELADRLAELPGIGALEAALLEIEGAIEGLSDVAANALLWDRYASLPLPAGLDALLASRLRTDTRVTLNGPEPRPLAARADILNRLLISRLVHMRDIEYVPGRIADVAARGGGYRVSLEGGAALDVDRVNIRHGTVPSLRAAFPDLWARYEPARRLLPHLTPEPLWPAGWFD